MTAYQLYLYINIILGFYTWMLLGQGLLFLFVGARGRDNFVYQLFLKINFPITWLTRQVTPSVILDRHMGFTALALVLVLRFAVYMVFFSAGAFDHAPPPGN